MNLQRLQNRWAWENREVVVEKQLYLFSWILCLSASPDCRNSVITQCEDLVCRGVCTCRYSTASLVAMETPANDEHDHDDDATANSEEEMPEQPKTPTSPIYNITLAPLSPDMFSNTNGRLDAPEGVRHVRRLCLMPVTHIPEISAKYRYLKTGTGFWRVWHEVWYRSFLVLVFGNN